MRVAIVLTVLAVLAGAAPRDAVAGGPPGTVEPPAPFVPTAAPPVKTRRYGHKILIGDAAWIGLTSLAVLAARADDNEDNGSPGAVLTPLLIIGGYFGVAPSIHMAHGNASAARKSLAARAFLPIGGLLVGGLGTSIASGQLVAIGFVAGAAAGVGGAMLLDWLVYSKKKVFEAPTGLALRPDVKITPRGVTLSLAGTF